MKKKKSLIALLLVFVLLVGGFIVYRIVDGLPSDDEPTTTTQPTEYLWELAIEDVERIVLENEDSEFTWAVEVTGEDDEEEYNFVLDSPEIANLEASTAASKATSFLRIRVDSVANESASELADYGLDDPLATATITLSDGTEHQLYMGDVLRNETTRAYARVDDSDRVVVVSGIVSMMTFTRTELVSSSILPFQLYEVDSFDFTRRSDQMVAHVELMDVDDPEATPTPEPEVTPSPSELNEQAMLRYWQFVEPFEWEADSTDINSLLAEFVSVSPDEILAVEYDDPADYGFDNPTYAYTLYAGDEEVTVTIGNEYASNVRYMTVSDRDELMTVAMSTFTLIDRPRVDLVSAFASLINIQEIGRIELTTPEGFYDMEVFHPSRDELDADETLDYVYTINGEDATVVNRSDDYYFRKLYSGILSMMVDGEDLAADPEGEPAYSVTITKRTGDMDSVTVALLPRNESTFYLFRNGEYTGFYTNIRRIDNESANETMIGLVQHLERMLIAMENAVDGKYIFPE